MDDWEYDPWDSEYCYECSGYGDDYYYDEETGDYVCRCFECWNSPFADDLDD